MLLQWCAGLRPLSIASRVQMRSLAERAWTSAPGLLGNPVAVAVAAVVAVAAAAAVAVTAVVAGAAAAAADADGAVAAAADAVVAVVVVGGVVAVAPGVCPLRTWW